MYVVFPIPDPTPTINTVRFFRTETFLRFLFLLSLYPQSLIQYLTNK